ncbi:zinc-binding dehydrogenase [Klebsiella pneumoniae]|uniref:zinc-binding dehydrogenase n=1 Tax=Klebsiella pneumoniae TaxID=573 RepID=UPI0030CB6D07
MKAAVVTHDHQVNVTEKTLRPLEYGEALLKMECCGVCHTDLHVKNGDFGDKTGVILGHEGIGVVQKVGPGVTSHVFNAKVIAIDVNDGQLELAASMGADLTINSRNEDAAKVIQEKTGGAHAAVVTAVAKAAFNSAVDAVRAGGRVVAVGLPPEAMSLDIPRLVLDGIEVVGSLVGTRQDLVEAFQFAAEGKVVPKVTLRPLEDINAIFKEMEQGQIRGRMVIDLRS